ncbi:MAG: hypothetical protein A2234_00270 [Elusimicrobia bacterium RIFOXYA2_FULL_58_8]|nr:MAG: hypothetical protein A2285_00910 [Elusimicrobia bacterium RIFOXYA12_FULL_57_11]OGS13244.1 MAG: hypothetical protein A2234_00270 [Elusimicrobia bacterium RIFOXYA2_FULL_58_8]
MDTGNYRILEDLARASMEKCMARLSRVSAGKWGVAGISVTKRSMAEVVRHYAGTGRTGTAVYFEVTGEYPFSSMVIFRPEDTEIISRGFLGFSFSRLPGLNQAQELLLSELGNIILNAFISSLSNELKRSFLPSAPKCVNGEARFLLEALWSPLGAEQAHSVVTITLDLQCDGVVTRSEVVAVIPESLELALAAGPRG